jgi:mannose-6-phosphate isomerase
MSDLVSDVNTEAGQNSMPEATSIDQSASLTPGTTDARPWGTVTVLEQGERYRINRIEVKPGHHISTQMHYHRSEHWIVVSGTARVLCNGEDKVLMQKQSTYVPSNTRHRVENPGVIPLVMIEVQNGEYLGEDDIIRYTDNDDTQ